MECRVPRDEARSDSFESCFYTHKLINHLIGEWPIRKRVPSGVFGLAFVALDLGSRLVDWIESTITG